MTEKKDPWEGYDPDAPLKEISHEELAQIFDRLDTLEQSRLEPPKYIRVLQGIATLYIVVNVGCLIAWYQEPVIGFILAYMLPLTGLLFFFIYAAGKIKKIARGEKK